MERQQQNQIDHGQSGEETNQGANVEVEVISEIKRLNIEYQQITDLETSLTNEFKTLQAEERLLRTALQQSKETGREKMARERKDKNEAALKNLEAALMCDDSSDSCSSDHG